MSAAEIAFLSHHTLSSPTIIKIASFIKLIEDNLGGFFQFCCHTNNLMTYFPFGLPQTLFPVITVDFALLFDSITAPRSTTKSAANRCLGAIMEFKRDLLQD
ncbi:hypothetical protein CEXT_596581 [Caerostris extrusa]|uniref:Uncharacterized protein n=1 Tax=Caerostris extrusa TaxID=172846 RepID=A0AAV4QHN0_CAEEX|nr:hypothetical protein CEXT_596581 [Caerostris extrusa]